MKKFLQYFDRVQNYLTASLMAVFIIVILIATFCRYTQTAVLGWSDELARYLMIWMIFLGCGAASREGAHFVISVIFSVTPKRMFKTVIIVQTLVTDAILLAMLYLSVDVIRKQVFMQQISPAMGIPMWFMYLAVPIGCLLMLIQGTLAAVKSISDGEGA